MPPKVAPIAYAISFVRTSGIPIETAATSSSRSAIQARPRRESRSRRVTNRTSSTIPKISQYHGLQLEQVELADAREVRQVERRDSLRAGGQRLAAADVDAGPVDRDDADDLPERERHDRDVVAAQAQRRQADERPGERGDQDRGDEDQDEVEVDAGFGRRTP